MNFNHILDSSGLPLSHWSQIKGEENQCFGNSTEAPSLRAGSGSLALLTATTVRTWVRTWEWWPGISGHAIPYLWAGKTEVSRHYDVYHQWYGESMEFGVRMLCSSLSFCRKTSLTLLYPTSLYGSGTSSLCAHSVYYFPYHCIYFCCQIPVPSNSRMELICLLSI